VTVPAATGDALVADSRAVLARHARSFRLASLLLPRAQADEAAVVYAFCRLIDDLADEAPSPEAAAEGLDQARAELEGRAPARPLIAAYLEVAHRRGIPTAAAAELMRGCLDDLGPVVIEDDAELLRYCYRVAGTVGLMMCGVLGVTEAAALPHAVDLGLGMQITNICRDVREDAARGRVYLPARRLRAVGISPEDLLSGRDDAELRAALSTVVRDLLGLADGCYRRAWHGMHHIPWRPRAAIVVASRLYRDIGWRLRDRHQGDAWHGRTIVPAAGRALGLVRGLLQAAHPVTFGLGADRRPETCRPSLHLSLAGLGGAPG
jgi:phytoene synthase